MEMVVAHFTGLSGRSNQVLYSCPARPIQHVVYFQGDIQDLRKNMERRYEDISKWKDFSLENTCSLLQKKFPGAAIWLIRPSNILRDIFGCFHNFVKSSIVGTPEYSTSHGAIAHLYFLLRLFCSQAAAVKHHHYSSGLELLSHEELLNLPVTLVGFSKGCVVLNQILHELNNYIGTQAPIKDSASNLLLSADFTSVLSALALPSQTENKGNISGFLKQITHFYWLDSGHSGEGEAWVTDKDILSIFSRLQAEVHVHVSPQQVCCPSRPWIGEEEKLFVSTLREMGIKVHETVHFNNEPRSLLNHFRILNEF